MIRFLLALLLLAGIPAIAGTDPGLAGPFTPGRLALQVQVTQGATLSTDVHFPEGLAGEVDPAAERCPALVFGHGFSGNKGQFLNLGAHWASRGYIVLMPDFEGGSDHSRNADDLVALVNWILERDLDPASVFHGRVDRGAIGSSGHSAGGLSALVATARDTRIRATAPMDPVDNNGLGAGAVPGIGVPVAITYSEDSPCNAGGSARDLYAACVPVKRGVKIVGANHCDPLDPSDFLCGLVCGFADPVRQELYRRYVTAWFEFWLRCDPSYYEWVYGTRVQQDLSAGRITYAADPDPGPAEPCPAVLPAEVTGLRLYRAGADVELRWDAVLANPPVTEYRTYRGPDPRLLAPVLAGSSAVTAFVDPGMATDGKDWFYQVRAANPAGEGP